MYVDFVFQAEDGIRDLTVTGVQTCALPILNSGSHGKFLSRLDLDVRRGRVADHRYRLIPVLAHYVPEDAEMARLVRELRRPWESKLGERLAVSESPLYPRGDVHLPLPVAHPLR